MTGWFGILALALLTAMAVVPYGAPEVIAKGPTAHVTTSCVAPETVRPTRDCAVASDQATAPSAAARIAAISRP